MQCIREKMDVIDIEDEAIDAEVLDSMAVSQASRKSYAYVCLCLCMWMPCGWAHMDAHGLNLSLITHTHTHPTAPLL